MTAMNAVTDATAVNTATRNSATVMREAATRLAERYGCAD